VTTSAGPDPALTLHSSWRMVIGGYVGPVALLAVVVFASVQRGFGPVAIVMGGVAVVLLAILLLDVPVATRFDPQGVERRMPLRHQRFAWTDIRQFTRASGRFVSTARWSSDREVRLNRGGLVAVIGRRRYLLVDQPESRAEFGRLQELLERVAPELTDDSLMPPSDASPTYLYRRKQWRTD
jgi:hypothetical protein